MASDLIRRKELLDKIQAWEKSITKRDWVSVNVLDTLSKVKDMVNNLDAVDEVNEEGDKE